MFGEYSRIYTRESAPCSASAAQAVSYQTNFFPERAGAIPNLRAVRGLTYEVMALRVIPINSAHWCGGDFCVGVGDDKRIRGMRKVNRNGGRHNQAGNVLR